MNKLFTIVRCSIFQFFSVIFLLVYLLGVLNIYFTDKTNYCLMTYMYEYPQLVRISLPENKEYPQYELYAYSEGRLTEKARRMWFDGIPVLFLPGCAGSHMQARSIASVALRKAMSKGYDFHFDYFTINFNEELTGLYGGVLQSQTKFAATSVSKILSLYKSNKYTKTVPTSVILIGHSMGGLIAKRLLAYPSTINTTNLVITLATPLEVPIVNFDITVNDYYLLMNYEWEVNINNNKEYKEKKMLISIAGGPRDLLVPSGLTASNDSYINALTTAIPGVWVSPDHVCIVWCKQLVMVINRFLFSLIDRSTEQIIENQTAIEDRARQFFVANRSMIVSPDIPKGNHSMVADAFWYEDNRRIYQVVRPEIDKTTYLMVRLVRFPQNRFLAVEAVNVDDKDWIFGCNAKEIYRSHRYCKYATSLNELSRWTGAAKDFGRRKLATVNLHRLMDLYPDWTHVIVRVSPTRKPIALNVDINDHASRKIQIEAPSLFSLGNTVVIQESEQDSLYYEIVLKDFEAIHQAYLLSVEPAEPAAGCRAAYHVSAEVHVPWAKNHEYYHFFTHLKRSPMKLRLFKSNPNTTKGLDATEYVKVTLLLDPQCKYTVSISSSWYQMLAQLARNYTHVLVPYIAAIVLLAVRNNIMNLRDKGVCSSVHSALCSESVKPYYALVLARLATMLTSLPILTFLFENASWNNAELQYFTKSLYILPTYMVALGILNISLLVVLVVMVFSSQIAHRLLFRLVWRGGAGLAERVASGLQKVPMAVSSALVLAAPVSCGAASLLAGGAFYAFMISKMYEEYLEDYFYKIISKIASKVCRMIQTKAKRKPEPERNEAGEEIKWRNLNELEQESFIKQKKHEKQDDDLTKLNFHMTMFLMWILVAFVNIPALLTWARNFKFSTTLKPDTSYHTGLAMSVCSIYIWQMDGPRKNLKYYDQVSSLIFTMAVFILALGPFSLVIVNYGVTFMFIVITGQQILDKEIESTQNTNDILPIENKECETTTAEPESSKDNADKNTPPECKENTASQEENSNTGEATSTGESVSENCDVCSENRIYNMFKNLREKFSFNNEEL